MWRVNEQGRLFAQGKPSSRDLRLLIINKIINDGGNQGTGIFPGKYIDIARSLGVSSAVVYVKYLETLLSRRKYYAPINV